MPKLSPTVLGYLGALYRGGALEGFTDGELLKRVVARNGNDRTDAELAFATLMKRHGRMVWRVCKSLVPDDHDAEDAFQATFLVLVQKAGSLSVRRTLGPWLHAVANRVGMSARAASLRRRTIERRAASRATIESGSRSIQRSSEIAEFGVMLNEELMRLPERFRESVVLCDLEGLSYQQAATRLNVPIGTLQSRLARARKRLRIQLTGRGFDAVGLTDRDESAGVLIAGGAGPAMPPLLLEQSTCRQCVALAAEPACLHTIVSSTVQVLIKKGAGSMFFSRWNAIFGLPIAATILCCGVVLNTQTKAEPRQDKDRRSDQPTVSSKTTEAAPATAKSGVPLITPTLLEQRAMAGRGKALVYALDDRGDRIPELEAVDRPARKRRVGADDDIDDRAPKRPNRPRAPHKQEVTDLTWVVVTGVVDHRAVQKRFAEIDDRSVPPVEQQIYRRVDLQRQRQEGESWSGWGSVDTERKYRILDNLPEVALERTDEEFRVDALVEPVPVLVEGTRKGLDVERLVPHLRDAKLVDPLREFGQPNKINRPPVLMVRAFDFAAEPGKTYRYRARLVFWASREIQRETRNPEVRGPWSEPTNWVTVP